ncbi:MAG TPA: HAD hydrolase-like protein [Tepidiformaceae bacterium]|nr:HAD hydrolase-like protein [Tepidiformaceae bacterium]
MGLAGGATPHPRAVIFDLDRCLIDARNAWRFCVEESIAAAVGERVDAGPLVEEYHTRPWRDVLSILTQPADAARCAGLCEVMLARSAMKKLLVHEGVGMALDALRSELIELGAISRLPHAVAIKQVQSTGLDRFLAVVATTPANERWDPAARVRQCLTFLEAEAAKAAFVSGDRWDREESRRAALRPYAAAWAPSAEVDDRPIPAPGDVVTHVLRDWMSRGAPN